MTAAASIDVGMGTEAGGRAGAGPGVGQIHAAAPGGAFGQGAAHETSESSVSSPESFRSRWQAMLNASGIRPGTESAAGQGTAIKTQPSIGTVAESADRHGDAGEEFGGTQETTLVDFVDCKFAAAEPKSANATPQYNAANEQTNGPVGGTTKPMPANPQSAVPGRRVAASPLVSVASAQTFGIAYNSRVNRSVRSDKPDSALQRTNAKPQAKTSNNEPLATPIEVMANPIAPARVVQAQILVTNFPVSTYSANAKPSEYQQSETRGVFVTSPQGTATSPANQQIGLAGPTEGQAAMTQQASAGSQHNTESGHSFVEAVPENSATDQKTNLAVTGSGTLTSQSRAAITASEKSNLDSARQPPEEAVTRFAHLDSSGEAAQPAAHTVLAQQTGSGGEAAGLVQVPAGIQGTVNAVTAHAGVTASAATGTAVQETFSAIDAGTKVGTPSWIHAGGQTAEAGFQDPALGWVGVRADMSGGSIHAALLPGSLEAAQTLSGHLSGLSAYLAEEHTPVASLTGCSGRGRSRDRRGPKHAAKCGPEPGPRCRAERFSSIAIEFAAGHGNNSCGGGSGY